MTAQPQTAQTSDMPALSVAEALKAFPEELRRLADVSRDVENTAGGLAQEAVDTDDMSLQQLDLLTQHLEGMANFIECLLKQADLIDPVERTQFIEQVKPYDLLQRLIEVGLGTMQAPDTDVDLF